MIPSSYIKNVKCNSIISYISAGIIICNAIEVMEKFKSGEIAAEQAAEKPVITEEELLKLCR